MVQSIGRSATGPVTDGTDGITRGQLNPTLRVARASCRCPLSPQTTSLIVVIFIEPLPQVDSCWFFIGLPVFQGSFWEVATTDFR
jgi:hypothetical protein